METIFFHYFLASEDVVAQKAIMVGFASITGHDFNGRHEIATGRGLWMTPKMAAAPLEARD
jgi:hypothetical protein